MMLRIRPEQEDATPESEEANVPEQEPKNPLWTKEIEDVARSVGWTPAENYKGPKEQWRDPVEFLRTGKATHQNLRAERDRDREQFVDTIRRTEKMAAIALENQKKQLEDRYRAQMRYAASQGDVEGHVAAEKALDEARSNFDKEIAPLRETPPPARQNLEPEVVEFVERNDWFKTNLAMRNTSVAMLDEVQAEYPHLPLDRQLNVVELRMKKEFPHKFNGGKATESPRAGPSRVEGGLPSIKTKTQKGWDTLPAEAKTAGKNFIAQGLFGTDAKAAQQAYADQYWAQD
jgi:hypothetical protein